MKISELVARLEEIKQEHGDLPVWIDDEVWWVSCGSEVEAVGVKPEHFYSDGLGRDITTPKRAILT
jgi:hypothetical protein